MLIVWTQEQYLILTNIALLARPLYVNAEIFLCKGFFVYHIFKCNFVFI